MVPTDMVLNRTSWYLAVTLEASWSKRLSCKKKIEEETTWQKAKIQWPALLHRAAVIIR